MTSLLALSALATFGQSPLTVDIKIDQPGVTVAPSLYGIFFEEINQAGDGGIYAELLRNRGFEAVPNTGLPVGWSSTGGAAVDKSAGLNEAHPASIKLSDGGRVVNDGFWGVPLEKGKKYRLVIWTKGEGKVSAALGSTTVALGKAGANWKRFEKTLTAGETSGKAQLALDVKGGEAWIGFASLMPVETWKGRKNGLRNDLSTAVAGMKPAFVRFPGGCYVEGGDRFEDAFDWKRSVGPIEERKGLARSMWGYSNTFGLGYHEYLQWCEDLGADPLFVVNCGINHRQTTPLDQMDKWISDALDAIEYANGPVTSKWGAVRAKNGHPKPFNLKYVEIGNENGGWFFGGNEAYTPRYRKVYDAIKAKYPNILTISNQPLAGQPLEIVDEHYYEDPAWFWRNEGRYDNYDRKGPKIYVGEYAVTKGSGLGNLAAAVGEAAFMVGMERNSDIVTMSSYAPLFVNVNNKQWNPDAIVYDATRIYGTPSYHVQALFGSNRPDHTVAIKVPKTEGPAPAPGGRYGLLTWRTDAEFKDIEVESDGRTVYSSKGLTQAGLQPERGAWSVTDGVIRQSAIADNQMALLRGVDTTGAKKTVMRLKARKRAGDEGFIIIVDEKDGSWLNWNLGGWNNSETAFQRNGGVVGKAIPVKIEANRWYDITIEREGNRTRGYLDGKLTQELVETGSADFTATAGVDKKAKELVVKVVNGSLQARTTVFNFSGAQLGKVGKRIDLTGPAPMSENSFDNPNLIAPKSSLLERIAPNMPLTFAPQSVTVIRIPIR